MVWPVVTALLLSGCSAETVCWWDVINGVEEQDGTPRQLVAVRSRHAGEERWVPWGDEVIDLGETAHGAADFSEAGWRDLQAEDDLAQTYTLIQANFCPTEMGENMTNTITLADRDETPELSAEMTPPGR